ncbi:MAG: NAD/NADP octopine/nopaline dehydrogenase family protein [Clostridia bacterium]|nr:NAD/NADP octopine/nopaline dehydrogenase family protein [Clostridia bacterium]
MDVKKVAVIGAGNIGTQFGCLCAEKGYSTTMISSGDYGREVLLETVDERDRVTHAGKVNFSSDYGVLTECDVVFVTHPSFMFAELGKRLKDVLRPGTYLCVLPGTGGAEFFFRDCIKKGVVLCGLQRVPGVARLVEKGKRVRVSGLRDTLCLASIPAREAEIFAPFLSDLVGIRCETLPQYLCVTMTPSNPILHTTRLRTMFFDYEPGRKYDKNPLFYGEWTDRSSALLLLCDAEHQTLLRRMSGLDLSSVRSLVEHYDKSDTPEKMTKKLRSISSLHGISSPMIQTSDGWTPDFGSRYFSADFPYGLAIIEEFAKVVGVASPNITETMDWYCAVTGKGRTFFLKDFGITSLADVYDYYQ